MEWLRQELRELAVDRGRIVLVLLGVVWGTLSLTVVLSFGEGFDIAMRKAMRARGRDMIVLWSGATTRPFAGLPAGRPIRLLPEDATLVRQCVPGAGLVSVEYASFGDALRFEGRSRNIRVHGVDPPYGELRSFTPLPGGRFLNDRDQAERRRVAFLGSAVKERVFGKRPAVGRIVEIWGSPFTVIGVQRPKVPLGNYQGHDYDKVLIPASTFRAMRGWRTISYLVVGVASPQHDRAILREVYDVLGKKHVFDPDDTAAVTALDHVETDRQVGAMVGGIRILMGVVGLVGLLVALVGVANVMYVLVEERTREIGIRMAIGARPGLIGRTVALEGLLLTFAGGALGVLSGVGVLWLLNRIPVSEATRAYLGEPVVSAVTAIAVVAVLAVSGSVAGYFPARRATLCDPIETLREE